MCKVKARGPQRSKMAYEISKSQRFHRDFKISQISNGISRFQVGFQDFTRDFKISNKISRFQVRFQDFVRDFKISSGISRFQ